LLPSGSVRSRPQRTKYPVSLLSRAHALQPCARGLAGVVAAGVKGTGRLLLCLAATRLSYNCLYQGRLLCWRLCPVSPRFAGPRRQTSFCDQRLINLGRRYSTVTCSVTSIPRSRSCSTNGRAGTWVSTPPAPRGISPRVIISATMAALQPVQRSIAVKPVAWSR
jgi:hypothetical protein